MGNAKVPLAEGIARWRRRGVARVGGGGSTRSGVGGMELVYICFGAELNTKARRYQWGGIAFEKSGFGGCLQKDRGDSEGKVEPCLVSRVSSRLVP